MSQSGSTPFGIPLGTPVSSLNVISDLGSGKFIVEPPSPHPLFVTYVVSATERYGVYWVKGITDVVENDAYGVALRALADRIADQLAGKYGRGEKVDLLYHGSIWNEPQYWMNALEDNQRTYHYKWEGRNAAIPVDLGSIFLGAVANSSWEASVHLEYSSKNFEKAQSDLDDDMSSVL